MRLQRRALEELFDRWSSVPVELIPAAVRVKVGRLTAEIEANLDKRSRAGAYYLCGKCTPKLATEEERVRPIPDVGRIYAAVSYQPTQRPSW